MYRTFKNACENLLRIPSEPSPPPGDQSRTRVFLAAKNYYKYLLVLWGFKTALGVGVVLLASIGPMIALFAGRARGPGSGVMTVLLVLELIALMVVLIGAVISLAMVRLDFEKRWYIVTDRSLRVREGIRKAREATVTFANIQHISISQGPIQRLLNIADLRVDTAGGGGGASAHGHQVGPNLHTVWFRGVDNANEIKELMQQRLRQLKDSGLGDHDDTHTIHDAPASQGMLAALKEVHAEARALRIAAAG